MDNDIFKPEDQSTPPEISEQNAKNGYSQNPYGQQSYQQQNYQQQNYGYQPNYNNNNPNYGPGPNPGMDTSPMSMGDWVLTSLALMIPCAGIILYFVWAFGKQGNLNRRNYCRAQLAILGVVLALYLVIILILGVSIAGAISAY